MDSYEEVYQRMKDEEISMDEKYLAHQIKLHEDPEFQMMLRDEQSVRLHEDGEYQERLRDEESCYYLD